MIFNRLILLNYFLRLEANLRPAVYNAETPAGDAAQARCLQTAAIVPAAVAACAAEGAALSRP
jgi:hypothetical protein